MVQAIRTCMDERQDSIMCSKIMISTQLQTRLLSAFIYIINTLYVINTSEHNPTQQLNSEDDWKDQLFKVTSKCANIIRYHTYRSQMENNFGSRFYRKDLGPNWKIEHNYLVVELKQEGKNNCFQFRFHS